MKTKKGFTLIELLVVIAIIGILSSVVLASLNSARIKARDARRLSDIKQLRTALEMYYNDNGQQYPPLLSDLVNAQLMPAVSLDPLTNNPYEYAGLDDGSGICASYHLGATLEDTGNSVFDSDNDAAAGTPCSGSNIDFNGAGVVACAAGSAAGTDACYDITP